MHASPRRAGAVVAAALVIAGMAIAPAPATEDFTLSRIAGATRYDTAAGAALEAFGTADAVVIARGDAFPDALAGSYFAGTAGAPLLLTMPDDLPDVSAQALDTLGATTVYLLGGTGAISEAVATEAAGEGETPRTVTRVAGANRYATAAEIASGPASADPASIGEVDGKRAAFLASGLSFADALAAGPVSFANNIPILLTPPNALAPEAAAALAELEIEHVIVVGGTAAVSESVADAAAGDGTSERVAGANRYATAVALADFALDTFDADNGAVDLATGESFADALAAGPAAGAANRTLLLTASGSLSAEPRAWMQAHAGTLAEGRVFGGTGAVAEAVVDAAEAAASGAVSGPAEGQLTFANTGSNTYRFVPDGADAGETVVYENDDTFTVDGAAATVGGFESAVTPGDRITHTPASGDGGARHELVNVAPASITEGTVGNVDAENVQLDIINAVNGDAIRSNLSYDNVLYEIDGTTATEDTFAAALNEGDEIAITGTGAQTTYELTEVDVEGLAGSITAGSNPVLPSTALKIDALGDDPATDADDTYVANGGPDDTDTFKVEGADSDYATFAEQLSNGDAVTYRRTGGVETFELINRTPSLVQGEAVDDLDPEGAPLPPTPEGGHFTVVTDEGPVAVDYEGGGTFLVNGSVANEEDFEAAYSAGDEIVFRAADEPSGTTQRLELRDRTLEGSVDPESVNTEDGSGAPLPSDGPPANSYGVLGQDGETVLRQVEYVSATASANTYFLNGAAVTLERFEQELDAIAAGTRSGTVQVQTSGSGDSAVTQHRLTTTGAPVATTTTTTTSGGGLPV